MKKLLLLTLAICFGGIVYAQTTTPTAVPSGAPTTDSSFLQHYPMPTITVTSTPTANKR